MLFSDLKKITSGKIEIKADLEVAKFVTDTRSLTGNPNDVFIAIKGATRDGHLFIDSAKKNGISNFIVEQELTDDLSNTFQVESSVDAFQAIAAHHRSLFSIPIVGITGSNGKTTVKEWLSTILSQKLVVVKSPKSFNSQTGVPLSILEIRPNHQVGVFEAGISEVDEMARLEKIIQPTLGIFTTLGAAHGKGFNSESEKLDEKLKLFSKASSLVCRKDTLSFAQLSDQLPQTNLISWSLDNTAKHKVSWDGGKIAIDGVNFNTNFTHSSEWENATHSIVAAMAMGLAREQIQSGLDLIRSIPMRLELKKGINGCFLLDDTYNNDLGGLKVAMDYLDAHKQNRKKTLILSDILNSGQSDEVLYKEVGELLTEKGFDRLIGIGSKIFEAQECFDIDATFFHSAEEFIEKVPQFSHEMVLIKGARNFQLDRIAQRLEEKSHGTVLEISFESLRHNLNQYRKLLPPATKLMVMVKANAYGSGILEVANFLQHENVDWLGVAYVDEAIQLRENGIDIPIMIMNPHISSFSQFERYDLQTEIFSLSHLSQLLDDVAGQISIHLKIDTGMHRLGFSEGEISELISKLLGNPQLKIESIFTHFSSSDDAADDDYTKEQATKFEVIYSQISEAIGYSPIKHACNSPAIVRWPQYHYDMVRLGIGLHGFDPTETLSLRPTGTLRTEISQIQTLKRGDTVGYSRKGKVARDSKIAVLPIGYEDGYLRVFGNGNALIEINGHLCPTIGNICMDMTMVDVSDIVAKEGDQAIVFGRNPSISDLAKSASTIPYEILTNVSSRVKRVFISE